MALAVMAVLPMAAQLNVQFHYDFGQNIYGKELSDRQYLTVTIENFIPDKWGNTYFFVDGGLGGNQLESVYAELSRELKFWEAPFAIHMEYNGGVSGITGCYNDAYLVGAAYNWANGDFSRSFSVQALYKYLARYVGNTKHSWQLTSAWMMHFANHMFTFSGYVDLWHDPTVNSSLILCGGPQFWFNLNRLNCVDDGVNLSVGAEVELSNNLVWPQEGKNNRFYAIPTLALKWTF